MLENAAYLGFQLDIWFRFRVWIKGIFKKEQVHVASLRSSWGSLPCSILLQENDDSLLWQAPECRDAWRGA
jgi:hypothetical protein